MSKIIVVGHKNPDNDSCMAAYTYANLKNQVDENNEYIACRLGDAPLETKMIFDEYVHDELPMLIDHVDEGQKVILVDHNEIAQAVDGIEKAEVVEVVDHHRIADLQTANPIFFMNLPLGSTASIVFQLYASYGIHPSAEIATCLLSAILTDTVILKSPTTTQDDKDIVAHICEHQGLDPVEFGMKIFKSRGNDLEIPIADVISRDSKEFNFGGTKAWIAQFETVDADEMMNKCAEIKTAIDALQHDKGYDVCLFMLTDIIKEGSYFICSGDLSFIEQAFNIDLQGDAPWMPGVLSRKKQVAATLIDFAG